MVEPSNQQGNRCRVAPRATVCRSRKVSLASMSNGTGKGKGKEKGKREGGVGGF
jgi:hypothetical protein